MQRRQERGQRRRRQVQQQRVRLAMVPVWQVADGGELPEAADPNRAGTGRRPCRMQDVMLHFLHAEVQRELAYTEQAAKVRVSKQTESVMVSKTCLVASVFLAQDLRHSFEPLPYKI